MKYLTLVALLLLACAPPPHPQEVDIQNASHVIDSWKPGDVADSVVVAFERVPKTEVHKVGWVATDEYRDSEGTISTLSVGYYYMSGNVGMYPIVDRKIMAVVTFKGGRVISIYRP